jgi:hypothetical protein
LRKSFKALLQLREAGGGGYVMTDEVLDEWIGALKKGRDVRAQLPIERLNLDHQVQLAQVPPLILDDFLT